MYGKWEEVWLEHKHNDQPKEYITNTLPTITPAIVHTLCRPLLVQDAMAALTATDGLLGL